MSEWVTNWPSKWVIWWVSGRVSESATKFEPCLDSELSDGGVSHFRCALRQASAFVGCYIVKMCGDNVECGDMIFCYIMWEWSKQNVARQKGFRIPNYQNQNWFITQTMVICSFFLFVLSPCICTKETQSESLWQFVHACKACDPVTVVRLFSEYFGPLSAGLRVRHWTLREEISSRYFVNFFRMYIALYCIRVV